MERINKRGYATVGCDMESFKKAVSELASVTHCKRVKAAGVDFLHSLQKVDDKKGLYFQDLSRTAIMDAGKVAPTIGVIDKQSYSTAAYKENITNLFALVTDDAGNEDLFSFSEESMASIFQLCKMSGENVFEKNNLIRNMFVSGCFYEAKKSVSLIYRETDDMDKKVYYVGLSRYAFVPQDEVLIPILDKFDAEKPLGNIKSVNWTVDTAVSQIYVEFPDVADEIEAEYGVKNAVPGMILLTSDIGASSLRALSTLKINGHRIVIEEVAKRHSGKGETTAEFIEKFTQAVDKEIFQRVKELPKQLCKLISMEIGPAALDTDEDRENNFVAVSDVLKESIDKTFHKFNASKKKVIFETLIEEIISSKRYTLYDIAAFVMSVADRVKVDAITAQTVNKEAAKAPFVVEAVARKYTEDMNSFQIL